MSSFLDRRRDAAQKLGVSEAQIRKWERDGTLHPINLKTAGGIRGTRLDAREVEALARKLIESGRT